MRKSNVRVEARDLPFNASRDEVSRNFKNLLMSFRQACNKAGIMKAIKKFEYYESKSQIKRRKEREKQATILKVKMKETFPETGTKTVNKNLKTKKRDFNGKQQ